MENINRLTIYGQSGISKKDAAINFINDLSEGLADEIITIETLTYKKDKSTYLFKATGTWKARHE